MQPYSFVGVSVPYVLDRMANDFIKISINGIDIEFKSRFAMSEVLNSYFRQSTGFNLLYDALKKHNQTLQDDDIIFFKRIIHKYPSKNTLRKKLI